MKHQANFKYSATTFLDWKILSRVMKLQVCTVALTVTLFISVISAVPSFQPSHSPAQTTNEEQKLQIISSSTARLEARFYTPTRGIYIVSEVQSNGEVTRVLIASLNGESVFAVEYPLDHSQGILTINANDRVCHS